MDGCRSTLSRFYCVILGFASGAIVLSSPATLPAQVPDVPGWQLSWQDEFNGTSVNTANWNVIQQGNNNNNEKEYYLPQQATVADGMLRITASNQAITLNGVTRSYRSARLESKMTFGSSGRYEARIDLPSGKGMWPAFWLNANAIPWPQGGEIDVMENKGSQPTDVSSAFHFQKNPGPCCSQHFYVVHDYVPSPAVNFQAGFHTYGVDWEPTELDFSVDGVVSYKVFKNTSTQSDANWLDFKNIILNLAVGGDFDGDPDGTTTFPQYMDVDYVRVWQKQTGLLGDYNKDGIVDASDYTVWRNELGQSGIGLAADGSGNGTVDQSDYNVWQANFGATAPGAGAGATSAVPEPPTFFLAAAALVAMIAIARSEQRRRCASPETKSLIVAAH
jgi:beta-glucanase (GH16 family)